MRQAANRITANPDTSRLTVTTRSELPDRFVGERAGTRDHADFSWLMNIPRHDADLAGAWSDDSRAIRADQSRWFAAHQRFDSHHVHHRDSFGDANNQFHPGIHGFKN